MYCDIPTFGRCCFCLPLRQGVLVYGCINIMFSVLMIEFRGYFVHYNEMFYFRLLCSILKYPLLSGPVLCCLLLPCPFLFHSTPPELLPLHPTPKFFSKLYIFSIFMIGLSSYLIQYNEETFITVYSGVISDYENIITLIMHCLNFLLNIALVFGAYKRKILFLQLFCYYIVIVMVVMIVMQLLGIVTAFQAQAYSYLNIEFIPLFIVGLALNLYLFSLVRSLLRKLQTSGSNYENQLHELVHAEIGDSGDGESSGPPIEIA